MDHSLTYTALVAIHVLAASAWFGAMFYSLFVLHPRARAFFDSPSKFEEFITFIAAGARWKVLSGCLVIGATGLALLSCTTILRPRGGVACSQKQLSSSSPSAFLPMLPGLPGPLVLWPLKAKSQHSKSDFELLPFASLC